MFESGGKTEDEKWKYRNVIDSFDYKRKIENRSWGKLENILNLLISKWTIAENKWIVGRIGLCGQSGTLIFWELPWFLSANEAIHFPNY